MPSNALSQLVSGTYTVNVLDANLCEGQFIIELTDPPQLEAGLQPTTISCTGAADGLLLAAPSGGTLPYSYTWENGSDAPQRDALPPGIYTLTLTDLNGCTALATYEMADPDPLIASIDSIAGPLCFGDQNGYLSVAVAGGQPPYLYQIEGSNAQGEPAFPNLAAGSHGITVTDSRDCITTADANVPEPESLTLTLTSNGPIVLGDNARLRAITNVTEPFILWSPPDFLSCTDCATPEVSQPTQSTTYQVEIADDKGCSITDSVNLTVLLRYPAYLPNAFSPNNDGINDTWAPQGGPALERWLYMQVYDRWGGLIFEVQNPNGQNAVLEWDGRVKNQPMPVGVYTCIIEGQFIDGTVRRFQSDVLLTR